MNSDYIKSPLNYIGGKYRILPQLMHYFPSKIGTMVDLFAGGGDIFANVKADRIWANDINYHVIEIFRAFKSFEAEELLGQIDGIIKEWNLTPQNEAAYIEFRKHYNKTHNPVELFVLICYSFNYQVRFNSKQEFNNPFGRNRSSFNPSIRCNLLRFHAKLANVDFTTSNFKELDLSCIGEGDFLYADPPYLITTGSYNDGKRGFEGWSETDDLALYEILDELNSRGVKFALSNVVEHKGKVNEVLNQWRRKYHTHSIKSDFSNSNYHAKNTSLVTKEVLITNY